MLNVCRAAKNIKNKRLSPSSFFAFIIITASIFITGCSNSVDAVRLNPTPPPVPRTFISNIETQGAAATNPQSTNFRNTVHSFGGAAVRTSSVSISFRLTGGVGVD